MIQSHLNRAALATLMSLAAGVATAQTTSEATATSTATAAEAPAYGPQKVVYHINGAPGEVGEAYRGAINNITNHLDAVGDDNIDLRVVLHGDGVGLLQAAVANQQLQGRLSGLKNRGVKILVCNNTLTGRNIDPDSLFEVWPEDIVPSGVAELGKLQGEGFAYIKP